MLGILRNAPVEWVDSNSVVTERLFQNESQVLVAWLSSL